MIKTQISTSRDNKCQHKWSYSLHILYCRSLFSLNIRFPVVVQVPTYRTRPSSLLSKATYGHSLSLQFITHSLTGINYPKLINHFEEQSGNVYRTDAYILSPSTFVGHILWIRSHDKIHCSKM